MNPITYWKQILTPWLRAKANPKTERGAALVEYALLVALIAVVCIGAIVVIGDRANNTFSSVGSKLPG